MFKQLIVGLPIVLVCSHFEHEIKNIVFIIFIMLSQFQNFLIRYIYYFIFTVLELKLVGSIVSP